LLVSETDRLRCEEAMKTAGRENQYPLGRCPGAEHMVRQAKTDPAPITGLRSKKTSSKGGVFFLDFPFYRTNQELARP
jgi:hypothetical protein